MIGYRTQWLKALFRGQYRNVAAEYQALSTKKNLLADIATRGGVFDPAPAPHNAQKLAWHEGRRSLALEIIHMAKADPMEIEAFVKSVIRNQPEKEPRHG
ncbi:MAG: hypothetical protein ACRDBL_11275 [Rhabdaerophilum sp.]